MSEFVHPFEALESWVKKRGSKVAAGYLRLGNEQFEEFQTMNWRQVFDRVKRYANVLKDLGLRPQDRLAILARNSVEWVLLDWAAVSSGIVTVPLYPQCHPDEVAYILKESEAKMVFVDQSHSLPSAIPQISFGELETRARSAPAEFTPFRLIGDEVVSIIYTSGTSGFPKGVVHTASNFYTAITTANKVTQIRPTDILISYLPLSHVVERVLIDIGSLYLGPAVFYIDRVEKLSQYLPKVRPTLLHSVPRLWEMIAGRVDRELNQPLVQQRLNAIPFFLRKFILRRFIRKKLGLDRTRFLFSGAAKLRTDTAEKFRSWGMPLYQGYGLTETLCVSAMTPLKGLPVDGSVGKIFPGVQARVEDDGEICLKAPFHFLGYYKHPEQTAEAIIDGWFHTGDIGRIDGQGFVYITDRKKSIFKTSNGKYVAPLPIETMLKEHPGIREVVVIGDERPHCVALANVEDSVTADELSALLDQVNSRLAAHQQVKSLGCMTEPWSVQTGELTPSQKVKRKVIAEKYRNEIDEMFHGRTKVKFFSPKASVREGRTTHA